MKKLLLFIFSIISMAAAADDDPRMMVIRTKGGYATRIPVCTVDSFYFDNDTLPQRNDTLTATQDADNWYVNVENPLTAKYLNEVDYTPYSEDFSVSFIDNYYDIPTPYRKDFPQGARLTWTGGGEEQRVVCEVDGQKDTVCVADSATSHVITNLIPGKRYDYTVLAGDSVIKTGHFFTLGNMRMMCIPSLFNVRDLGGKPTADGRKMRYGRVFRGSEMNDYYDIAEGFTHRISPEDSIYMHDVLRIRLDLDLRDNRDMNLYDKDPDNNRNHTELGKDVEYYNEMVNYYYNMFTSYMYSGNQRWGRALKRLIRHLGNGNNVYFHCIWGGDRSGILAMLIEGLCGVPQSEIEKDYEITCFTRYKTRTLDYWRDDLQYVKSLEGNTLQEKFETYCKSIGLTDDEILTLRRELVE